MNYKEIFEEESHPLIKDLEGNHEYVVIRANGKYLLDLDDRDFCYEFDYVTAKSCLIPVSGLNPVTGESVEHAAESYFLLYLQISVIRAIYILEQYVEHCNRIVKPYSDKINEKIDLYYFKKTFLEIKFKKLDPSKDIFLLKQKVNKLETIKKESRQNLLEGKSLNLAERYRLADQLFGIDKFIRGLNISNAEMSQLVGLIFDCNPTNARHIFNGKYTANVKEEMIDKYIQSLNR